ncbi:hypothetical protein ACI2QJ_003183 [Salmonella enterica subsp. enterica]
MSKLSYRLIKVCYPTALIPMNHFFLNMLINNCGCPENHIAIYFLQSIYRTGVSYFFFNYSQALKQYKILNGITNKDDSNIDENDFLTFKVEIDTKFDYYVDDITTYDFFDVGCINLGNHFENASTQLLKDNAEKELEYILTHIKEDSYYIYDKVKIENLNLKETLGKLVPNINDSKGMQFN